MLLLGLYFNLQKGGVPRKFRTYYSWTNANSKSVCLDTRCKLNDFLVTIIDLWNVTKFFRGHFPPNFRRLPRLHPYLQVPLKLIALEDLRQHLQLHNFPKELFCALKHFHSCTPLYLDQGEAWSVIAGQIQMSEVSLQTVKRSGINWSCPHYIKIPY